jgi:hypothetical protein
MAGGHAREERGVRFDSRTRLRVDDLETRAVRVVSPNDCSLRSRSYRDARCAAEVQSRIPTRVYMRGVTSTLSLRALLAATEPIFAVTPRAVAARPFPRLNANRTPRWHFRVERGPGDWCAADAGGAGVSVGGALGRERLALELSELLMA